MKCDFFPRPEIRGQHANRRDHRIFCPLVMRGRPERLIRELASALGKVLAETKKAGQVRLAGRGRGAYWENAGPREAP